MEQITQILAWPAGWAQQVRRRHMLLRVRDQALVTVLSADADRVLVQATDASGLLRKRTRRVPVPLGKLETGFLPYRPCRWTLTCLEPAALILPAFDQIEVCTRHGQDFQAWWATDKRGYAPEPECWCTEHQIEYHTPAEYCPQHGTLDHRGTEISAPQTFLDLPTGTVP